MVTGSVCVMTEPIKCANLMRHSTVMRKYQNYSTRTHTYVHDKYTLLPCSLKLSVNRVFANILSMCRLKTVKCQYKQESCINEYE